MLLKWWNHVFSLGHFKSIDPFSQENAYATAFSYNFRVTAEIHPRSFHVINHCPGQVQNQTKPNLTFIVLIIT